MTRPQNLTEWMRWTWSIVARLSIFALVILQPLFVIGGAVLGGVGLVATASEIILGWPTNPLFGWLIFALPAGFLMAGLSKWMYLKLMETDVVKDGPQPTTNNRWKN